jgi:predicted MFS family arabinose efflux permease
LFTWGVAAAVGVFIGGGAVDRLGSRQVIIPCLAVSIPAFSLLSVSAHWLPKTLALVPVLIGVIAWGIAHWSFYPTQQAGLVSIAGLRGTPIALSLKASFMGFSLGAALGSLTLSFTSVSNLGWAAAACEVAALILAVSIGRRLVKVRNATATAA